MAASLSSQLLRLCQKSCLLPGRNHSPGGFGVSSSPGPPYQGRPGPSFICLPSLSASIPLTGPIKAGKRQGCPAFDITDFKGHRWGGRDLVALLSREQCSTAMTLLVWGWHQEIQSLSVNIQKWLRAQALEPGSPNSSPSSATGLLDCLALLLWIFSDKRGWWSSPV